MPIIPVAPIYETASVDPASLMLDRSTGTIGGRHGDRQKIFALEHAWDQALERSDAKALSAIFDSALIYIDYDGSLLTNRNICCASARMALTSSKS